MNLYLDKKSRAGCMQTIFWYKDHVLDLSFERTCALSLRSLSYGQEKSLDKGADHIDDALSTPEIKLPEAMPRNSFKGDCAVRGAL